MSPSAEPEIDPRILRALADPVRQEVLTSLSEAPSSAATLSHALELPIATVREHLAALVDNDAAEAVDDIDTARDDRRYRAMLRPFLDDAHWRQLSGDQRQALFGLTLQGIARRIDDAKTADGFGHPQTHVSLTRLELDEQGWQELSEALLGVLDEAARIQERSNRRRSSRAPGAVQPSELAILHFAK
jgi:DNA-binding transcriptional ArsR family regulator